MNSRVRLGVTLLFGVVLMFVPLHADAFGKAADAMCTPYVIQQCGCMQKMGQYGCEPDPSNKWQCPCQDTGSPTAGICTMTNHCEGKTAGGKPVDAGLQQLGQMLQQLLSKLGQGGGGGGGAPPAPIPPVPTTGCQGAPFQTSDITQLSNPCAQYVAPPVNIGGVTCDTLSAQLGTCSPNTTTSTNSALTASPNNGAAPLSVTFTATVPDTFYNLDLGDGSQPQNGSCSDSCVSIPVNTTYTYTTPGTYTATLTNGAGITVGTATITVTSSAPVSAAQAGGTSLTNLFSASNTLDLSGLGASSNLTPGPQGGTGDITFSLNGTTIFGTSENIPSNTSVAGFFGSDNTFGNSQPQGLAAQLCQSRPWANGFISDILPTTFFDGLCTWRGYQVGMPPPPTPPVVQLQQSTPAPQPAATTTAPAFTSSVPPQVRIWAAPASVPLDTRTSIFWTSQGVTGCTETSPDGSFNQNSLSGGAATVPITDATTYTISCVDQDGNPVTDSVTVNLSI